jgi:hypothetical protein
VTETVSVPAAWRPPGGPPFAAKPAMVNHGRDASTILCWGSPGTPLAST